MERLLWKTVGMVRKIARAGGANKTRETELVCSLLQGLARLPAPVGPNALYVLMKVDRSRRAKAAVENFETRLKQLGRKDVCIDAGANFGAMTVRLASTGATVHAFEPDPFAFEKLKQATAGLTNVVLHNAALSSQSGTVTLHRSTSIGDDPVLTEGSSLMRRSSNADIETVDVAAVDIANFVDALPQDSVAIVKMDVEGEEINLLKHLIARDSLQTIDSIFVELHERHYPEQKPEIIKLLGHIRRLRKPAVNLDWP